MKRFHVLIGWLITVALLPATAFAQTSSPTYTKDIAPLLNAKCATCHRPGEVAPMSLLTYNEVRPWARAIKSKVISRQMPPWYAEGEPGKWHNDRRLTQAEIDKLSAWADAGAPRGNEGDMPAPPKFAQGWNHPSGRPPDLIIEAPEMKVPAEGESPWLFAYVKLPFEGDIWVAASQVVPGNRAAVHHVMVTDVRLPPNVSLDAEGRVQIPQGPPSGPPPPPAGGGGAANAPPGDGEGFTMGFYGGWEPGVDAAVVFPEGVAEHITGTHFMFNLHYQATGKAVTDRTRIGLWLQKGPVTQELRGSTVSQGSEVFLAEGKELTGQYTAMVTTDVIPPGMVTVPDIPAFADNYRLTNILTVRRDLTLYAYQPHMHLRGKSMKYTAVFPDGREEVLIDVPKYDFNWQIIYELAKPVTVPAGSTIRAEATWDNSTKNKYNPKPEQEVRWGEQSWDEMFSPIIRGAVLLKNPVTPVAPRLVR